MNPWLYVRLAGLAIVLGLGAYGWVTIHDLRVQNADQAQTIINQQVSLQTETTARLAAESARRQLQANIDLERKVTADAREQLDATKDQLDALARQLQSAPAPDRICTVDGHLPRALVRALDGLFADPAAAGGGPGR